MVALLHGAVNVAGGGFLCHVVALVIELFAFTEAEGDLYPAALEVQRQRDQREPLLLDLAVEAASRWPH